MTSQYGETHIRPFRPPNNRRKQVLQKWWNKVERPKIVPMTQIKGFRLHLTEN